MNNNSRNKEMRYKENINNTFLRTLRISYDEFDKLNFDEQQKIIREYHKKILSQSIKKTHVMIGSGENSTFIGVNKRERVMIGSGEHSCFVKAGLTLEEEKRRTDDKIDDTLYNKPVALVKKIARRIKR